MAPKRAVFMSYGSDEACVEMRKFIEESGIILQVRDISKQPLSEYELTNLIGQLRIEHFLNTSAPSFGEHKLDQSLPPRNDLIKLMVQDHTLIRKPIIKAARLITIGCDKDKIAEMLQINDNGDAVVQEPPPPRSHRHKKAHAGRS